MHQHKTTINPPITPVQLQSVEVLAEQLNGLIDRYIQLHGIYSKYAYMADHESTKERIGCMLSNIETAIDAIITEMQKQPQYLIRTELR